MKNLVKGALMIAIAALVTGAISNTAEAHSLYACGLKFMAHGSDVQFLIGHEEISGHGKVVCRSSKGKKVEMPVKITISAPFIFPRVAFEPHVCMRGVATGVGLITDPAQILGQYLVVDARAAVGVGASVSASLHGYNNGLSLNMSLAAVEGLGIAAGASILTVEPM